MKNVYYKLIGMTDPAKSKFVFQEPDEKANVFIRRLLEYTMNNRRTRAYTFAGESIVAENVLPFAKAALDLDFSGTVPNLDTNANAIAGALLKAEEQANVRLKAMGKSIPTGSLVLALVCDDDNAVYFIIAKVDHTKFFEANDLTEQTGFSGEDKDIWKTAAICISEKPEICTGDVLVYMDNSAKYWTDGFLALIEKRTDAFNSKLMYKSVLEILKKVESVSANDFLLLWATLARRMRSGGEMDYDAFAKDLLAEYVPQNPRLDAKALDLLKEQMDSLPEKKGFDRRFVVDPSDMASMLKKQTLEVADGIELSISDKVVAPGNWITTCKDPDGTKYLKIRCRDAVYKKFRKV